MKERSERANEKKSHSVIIALTFIFGMKETSRRRQKMETNFFRDSLHTHTDREKRSVFCCYYRMLLSLLLNRVERYIEPHRGYLAHEVSPSLSLDTLNANFNCSNGSDDQTRDTATGDAQYIYIARCYCWLAVIVLYLFIELYIKAPHLFHSQSFIRSRIFPFFLSFFLRAIIHSYVVQTFRT